MANVAHNTLTGADLHEPKGIGSAAINTVYVADGVGSGAWSSGSLLVGLTGQIADFATPVAPTGWLECDGSTQLRSTFATLFSAVTIQQTGSRTSGSAIITALSSTTNMRSGYTIGGTGITNGTTILTVDSATQVTMSANAGSTGSATVIVSPWAQGDGTTTFTLPNVSGAGRYRRSRTSSSRMGVSQADVIVDHAHLSNSFGFNVTSSIEDATHTHGVSGSTGLIIGSIDHTHNVVAVPSVSNTSVSAGGATQGATTQTTIATGANNSSLDHTHGFSVTSVSQSANHHHTVSGNATGNTSSSLSPAGSTETRPITLVVMTCIKT